MSTTVQPGWYPDPSEPSRSRYWDGRQWTQRTRRTEALSIAAQKTDEQRRYEAVMSHRSPYRTRSGLPWWWSLIFAYIVVVIVSLATSDDSGSSAQSNGGSRADQVAADAPTGAGQWALQSDYVMDLTVPTSWRFELSEEDALYFDGRWLLFEDVDGTTGTTYVSHYCCEFVHLYDGVEDAATSLVTPMDGTLVDSVSMEVTSPLPGERWMAWDEYVGDTGPRTNFAAVLVDGDDLVMLTGWAYGEYGDMLDDARDALVTLELVPR